MNWVYDTPAPEEIESAGAVISRSLSWTRDTFRDTVAHLGLEHRRVVRDNGRVIASLCIIPAGQWFGGRAVPTGAIGDVGVSPAARGRGVAGWMLREMLAELRERSIPLSTLYPSAYAFYRKAGYENAGVKYRHEYSPRVLPFRRRDCEFVELAGPFKEQLDPLYLERARRTNGHMDRTEHVWERLVRHKDRPDAAVWRIDRDGAPEGYAIVSNTHDHQAHDLGLFVSDCAFGSRAAGEALLTFLADHRSVVGTVSWPGAAEDDLMRLLPDRHYSVSLLSLWMVRIVDVKQALEGRGYPEEVEAELHLQVRDDGLPWNDGRWVLQVGEGKARVESGGNGKIVVDVRELAAVYSSYLHPIIHAPTLTMEADDADRRQLARVFAGPQPWMADGF